jgi:hypothetical protein
MSLAKALRFKNKLRNRSPDELPPSSYISPPLICSNLWQPQARQGSSGGGIVFQIQVSDHSASLLSRPSFSLCVQTFGNHEFDKGPQVLADYIGQLNLPIVGSNTMPSPNSPIFNKFPTYKVSSSVNVAISFKTRLILPFSSHGKHTVNITASRLGFHSV